MAWSEARTDSVSLTTVFTRRFAFSTLTAYPRPAAGEMDQLSSADAQLHLLSTAGGSH